MRASTKRRSFVRGLGALKKTIITMAFAHFDKRHGGNSIGNIILECVIILWIWEIACWTVINKSGTFSFNCFCLRLIKCNELYNQICWKIVLNWGFRFILIMLIFVYYSDNLGLKNPSSAVHHQEIHCKPLLHKKNQHLEGLSKPTPVRWRRPWAMFPVLRLLTLLLVTQLQVGPSLCAGSLGITACPHACICLSQTEVGDALK